MSSPGRRRKRPWSDLHLTAKEEPAYSTTIYPGFVVTTNPPPGTTVPGHSTVVVFASIGPPFVKVPSLFADSVTVAEQKLRDSSASNGASSVHPAPASS